MIPRPQETFSIEAIQSMVHDFYTVVRDDHVLGPIFAKRVDDWPVHMERMVLFWRAVLRSEPTFKPSKRGGPPHLHQQINELEHAHFERWLMLFTRVVDNTYPEEAARYVKTCAARIASSLARHLPPQPTPTRL